ncbi:WLM domain-containing protein [Coprinopsis sp. MPI-PUGE-AT-0042]|nr:WLM domain-containing protein [Coprinopsis sp. MPI-PUGE-AT-0042]
MVHLRLNEAESTPNPHINFITALQSIPEIQQESLHVLRALAAQVKPVMKRHGFEINSLEEYEFNAVFAGRNWNNGETVELVLRRQGGDIYPTSWLMSTFCHELAHIKHMNHGPAFQALWKQLREEVRQLQNRGYYGDGYWSSGQRLADSARIPGDGIDTGEFPEYMCGGAQKRSRPTARRRRAGAPRGPKKEVIPSLHTGRQTEKKRKAGGRVTSKYAFAGEGNSLGGSAPESTKGKRAASNRAREERALAVERRLQALSQGTSSTSQVKDESPDASDEEEYEATGETDAERRDALLNSKQEDDEIEYLGSGKSWRAFDDDFSFVSGPQSGTDPPGRSSTEASTSSSRARNPGSAPKGLGNLVKAEVELRKKEALGLAPVKGKGRTLGTKPLQQPPVPPAPANGWSCTVCTLINEPGHLACSACATPKVL